MAWIGAGEAVLALPLDEDKPGVFSLDIEQRQTVRMTERVAITDLCEDCGSVAHAALANSVWPCSP